MKVSLIIPTLNRHEVLVETLFYALKQGYKNFEIIVVDQNSYLPQSVLTTLTELAGSKKIKWIRADGWANLPAARNTGIKYSTGEIIIFIDDDVFLENDFIQRYVDAYNSNPSVHSIVGRVLGVAEGMKPRNLSEGIDLGKKYSQTHSELTFGGRGCNMSFHKKVFSDYNCWFDERFVGNAMHEESMLFHCMKKKKLKVFFSHECTLIHLADKVGGCRIEQKNSVKDLVSQHTNFLTNVFLYRYSSGFFLGSLLSIKAIYGYFSKRVILQKIKNEKLSAVIHLLLAPFVLAKMPFIFNSEKIIPRLVKNK